MRCRNVRFIGVNIYWVFLLLTACGSGGGGSETGSGVSKSQSVQGYIESLGVSNGINWTALFNSRINTVSVVDKLPSGQNGGGEIDVISRTMWVRNQGSFTTITLLHELGHQLEYDATGRVPGGTNNSHLNADACVSAYFGNSAEGICYTK